MEGRAPPRRHRRDHDRRLITARDIRRQTLGCASVQQFPPSEGVPVGGWACQDRRVAAPSVVQVSLGLGDEIARTRRPRPVRFRLITTRHPWARAWLPLVAASRGQTLSARSTCACVAFRQQRVPCSLSRPPRKSQTARQGSASWCRRRVSSSSASDGEGRRMIASSPLVGHPSIGAGGAASGAGLVS